MTTDKDRVRHRLYMRERRRKQKEQRLKEAYLKEKLELEEQKQAEIEELPELCERFRLGILNGTLSLNEKHQHIPSCEECYDWFLNLRKTYGGVRFW